MQKTLTVTFSDSVTNVAQIRKAISFFAEAELSYDSFGYYDEATRTYHLTFRKWKPVGDALDAIEKMYHVRAFKTEISVIAE